jgi:sugar phosphate isomerase/epimerase
MGVTPEEAATLFRELGLQVPSAHTPLPLGDDKNAVLDAMTALGATRVVPPLGPSQVETMGRIEQTCDLLNEAHSVVAANGMSLHVHNHWWEYQLVEGVYPYQVMLRRLHPDICFEVDTYWVQVAGPDPAEVVAAFGARAPLIHVKDGPAVPDAAMVPLGEGVIDIPSVVAAAGDSLEWVIVELDHCEIDMLEAVDRSYRYLVSEGLARGNT